MDASSIMITNAPIVYTAGANASVQLNTIIVAIIGFLGVLVTTFGTILLAKINANSQSTKAEVQALHITTRNVYEMVNKPFGVALETAAKAMEFVASMPGATDEHLQAAKTARKVSDDHAKAMDTYEMDQRVRVALQKAAPAT